MYVQVSVPTIKRSVKEASVANKDRRGEFVTVIDINAHILQVPKLNLFNFDTPEQGQSIHPHKPKISQGITLIKGTILHVLSLPRYRLALDSE